MSTATIDQPQHLQALDRANDVRSGRRELKEQIAAARPTMRSRREAASVIATPPSIAQTMRVRDLLRSARWVGRTKASQLVRAAGASETARICDLSERQRALLVSVLDAPGERTSMAAAIVSELWRAGLRQDGLVGWWRTDRDELGGMSPRQALGHRQVRVLELARSDATQIALDLDGETL